MFYTPNFCGECGDKIDPNGGKFWTRRRFCENCESDFKWQKWLPGIWIAAGTLGVVYGFGSYLQKPEKPVNSLITSNTSAASNKNRNTQNQTNPQILTTGSVQSSEQKTAANNSAVQPNVQTSSGQKPAAGKQSPPDNRQNPPSEAVYICGAQTKKGTPCLRRVKGGGRCWQHTGQPAILPPEKLLVSR